MSSSKASLLSGGIHRFTALHRLAIKLLQASDGRHECAELILWMGMPVLKPLNPKPLTEPGSRAVGGGGGGGECSRHAVKTKALAVPGSGVVGGGG